MLHNFQLAIVVVEYHFADLLYPFQASLREQLNRSFLLISYLGNEINKKLFVKEPT